MTQAGLFTSGNGEGRQNDSCSLPDPVDSEEQPCLWALFLAQGREGALGGQSLVQTLGQASFLSSVSLVRTHDYINIAS